MSEQREPRILMISPDSKVTPDQLVRAVHTMVDGLSVKETCYGCLVESTRENMQKEMAQVRATYRNEVFSKRRGYPQGDPRRCRAQHGTRPGFAQLEEEWQLLSKIQYGLEKVEEGAKYVPPQEKKRIPVNDFKKICEVH